MSARLIKGPTPFVLAITDPKLDLDVSDVVERIGVLESGILKVRLCVLRAAYCSGRTAVIW